MKDKFSDETKIKNLVSKYIGESSSSSTAKVYNESVEIKIPLSDHYSAPEKMFMLGFYNDLANCSNDKILILLDRKRKELASGNYSDSFKTQTNVILYSVEHATIEVLSLTQNRAAGAAKRGGFLDCMSQKGNTIGRGIAGGAITGAINGATIGLAGGTVALPGFGTVAGAVGGAVFGAASGAVSGAVGGLTWAFVDCSLAIKEKKYLNVDDFVEAEMPELKLSQEEKELFSQVLTTPNTVRVKFIP